MKPLCGKENRHFLLIVFMQILSVSVATSLFNKEQATDAKLSRPYIPLNSLTFKAADNGNLTSWMIQGPSILRQMLKQSKLGVGSKEEQRPERNNSLDKQIMEFNINKSKGPSRASGAEGKTAHSKDIGNAEVFYLGKERGKNKAPYPRTQSASQERETPQNRKPENYGYVENDGKPVLNRRFIANDSKLKLAELEKTKPVDEKNSNSDIIWIFTTPEHMYTLSGSTQPTFTDNDIYTTTDTYTTTDEPTSDRKRPETPHTIVSPTEPATPAVEGPELTISTTQIPDYVEQDASGTTSSALLTEDYSGTEEAERINIKEATDGYANGGSTTTDIPEYTNAEKYDSTTFEKKDKLEITTEQPKSTTAPQLESTNSVNVTSFDTTSINKNATHDVSPISPTIIHNSNSNFSTYGYPMELDILSQIKKVYQILNGEVNNVETEVSGNKNDPSYVDLVSNNKSTDNFPVETTVKDDYTKETPSDALIHSSTVKYGAVDVEAETEENLASILESLIGNLKDKDTTRVNIVDSHNFTNKPFSETRPIIGITFINTTTPSPYPTKPGSQQAQYTPLVQLNVWNYLNGQLHLKETQAVPSPTIDIINDAQVSNNSEHQPSILLHPYSGSKPRPNPQYELSGDSAILNSKFNESKRPQYGDKPNVDNFEFINILSYLDDQTNPTTTETPATPTTDKRNVIPTGNLYDFVMNNSKKKDGSTLTKEYGLISHDNSTDDNAEKLPEKEALNISSFRVPIKATSFVFYPPAGTPRTPIKNNATDSIYKIVIKPEVVDPIVVSTEPSKIPQPLKKYSQNVSTTSPITQFTSSYSLVKPTEKSTSMQPSPVVDSLPLTNKVYEPPSGIFNNSYLPSILQIYHQQNNLNSQLVNNHLNTQQYITINNHPVPNISKEPKPNKVTVVQNKVVVVSNSSLIKNESVNSNTTFFTTPRSVPVSTIEVVSSPNNNSIPLEEQIHILNHSEIVNPVNEGYPSLNSTNKVSSTDTSSENPFWKIDSVTLVREYIKRVSLISNIFKETDVSDPDIASMIENLALKSLLSHILGEEDFMALGLNGAVADSHFEDIENQPSSEPTTTPSDAVTEKPIVHENEISQSLANEAGYEINVISKLVFDAILQDENGQSLFNQISTSQFHSEFNSTQTNHQHFQNLPQYLDPSIGPVDNKLSNGSGQDDEPISELNQELERPLLGSEEQNSIILKDESLLDLLNIDGANSDSPEPTAIVAQEAPVIAQPNPVSQVEPVKEDEGFMNTIKVSVSGITGMLGNLVPTGETFTGCLNNLACAFALASSLAVGATGALALPFIVPFGRKKKQLLLEEARIFGHPVHEHDRDEIMERQIKNEFKRVLTYLAHPDESKSPEDLHVMKGNLIKYLKEEFEELQKQKRETKNSKTKTKSGIHKSNQ